MKKKIEKLGRSVEKHYSTLLEILETGKEDTREIMEEVRKGTDEMEAHAAKQDARLAELKKLAGEK